MTSVGFCLYKCPLVCPVPPPWLSQNQALRKMLTVSRARVLILGALSLLSWGTTAQNLDSCPGYSASNVVSTGSTLTADLSLNGPACNVYGTDLTDLKLVVEYQTGMYIINSKQTTFYTKISNRYSSACPDLRCCPTSLSGKKVEEGPSFINFYLLTE